MNHRVIQSIFAPFKEHLPKQVANLIRSFFTAVLTPLLFSYRTGHFRSSWKMAAVSKTGAPIPWYTYPCIDFLKYRNYKGKTVLEFGGGQSSLWWAQRAELVLTLEGDNQWREKIRKRMPSNVRLLEVSMENATECTSHVIEILKDYPKFDIIVIDGLYRYEMIPVARRMLADSGAIICDNAEAECYRFYEGFKGSGMNRIDFFGNAPGVLMPHCTSILFGTECFLLWSGYPIPALLD